MKKLLLMALFRRAPFAYQSNLTPASTSVDGTRSAPAA